MIVSCNQIAKAFGTTPILENCSFHIEAHEKAAIVGINGAGKSTLLKIIMGEIPADSGTVTFARDTNIGYLAQRQTLKSGNTIYEELLDVKADVLALEKRIRQMEQDMDSVPAEELDAFMDRYNRLTQEYEDQNGYACQSEVTGVLKGLGFQEADFTLPVDTLSGGQKTRVALGRLLLSDPDVLLLDEPTNHLDMASISWLENYLLSYHGSVIIVAHDRYFLDKIVTKVIEIEQAQVTVFSGNYSDYAAKKAILRNMKLKEYLNQQRNIQHQEAVITKLKQFNREKSIKRAESREKMLEKIQPVDKPAELNDHMHLSLEPAVISGNDVLTVTDLSKSFDDNQLFRDISFTIRRGERVALIGNNGTGKTTMLKIINQMIPSDSGTIQPGAQVTIGYYDQEHQVLNPDHTLFEEMQDAYPDLTNTRIRTTLAAFLFTDEDVFKYIRDLSGGEKGRVSLAKLMLSNANFLILDEPTNHLDMVSKEILEQALNQYTGTVLYVSHDRYFINMTTTRILELSCHQITNFIGNYDYYLEKKALLSPTEDPAPAQGASASVSASASEGKTEWKLSREEQARQRRQKKDLEKTEAEITALENEIAALDEEAARPDVCTNMSRLLELHKKKEESSEKLADLYEKWEELSD